LLVANDAPLFATNVAGQTPCSVAAKAKHVIIAQLLESKMVFAVRAMLHYVITDHTLLVFVQKSQGAHRSSNFSCSRREKVSDDVMMYV